MKVQSVSVGLFKLREFSPLTFAPVSALAAILTHLTASFRAELFSVCSPEKGNCARRHDHMTLMN